MQSTDRVISDTRSVCPTCLLPVPAQVVRRDQNIVLEKACPTHGSFEALLSTDADWYEQSLPYNKPGTLPKTISTGSVDGCPKDCGLCPEHTQHTCVALIEVNSHCNLDCPICFADAQQGFSLSLAQVEKMIDRYFELEHEPEVLQFSGGEPTIHPEIIPMMRLAKKKGVKVVMLNTNGLRIARDDRFLAELSNVQPTVYLQFDGFRKQTHEVIRGKDLIATKLKALDRLAQAKLDVVLVPAIEKGVNHEEIGAIVKFGIEHPAVRGIAFQPVTHSGRFRPFNPMNRETLADVVHGIEEQTGGMFVKSDFIPVPCCHPTCRVATYAYLDHGKVVPLPRVVPVDKYLDYVANRALPDLNPELLSALEGLWSASSVPGSEKLTHMFFCSACNLAFPSRFQRAKEHIFMIVVQSFGDAYTMDLNALRKCCVGELVPDGRMIPFCAYNTVGYREQVRKSLMKAGQG